MNGRPTGGTPIGSLARATGSTLRTIRWYVEQGLLVPLPSAKGARARFPASAEKTVRTVHAFQEAGFALAEIKSVLDAVAAGRTKGKELTTLLRRTVTRQRDEIQRREAALRAIRQSLDRVLAQTARCDTCKAQGASHDCAGCGNLELLKSLGAEAPGR